MSHPLPAFAPRRSTSQMLNYVVSILLILTLGAIAFLTLRTTPQIEEANELCQMTANAESKLWKISALSGRLLGSNPHDLTSEMRLDLSQEQEQLDVEFRRLSHALESSPALVREQLANAIRLWHQSKVVLERQLESDTPLQLHERLAFERNINSIMIALGVISDLLLDSTEQIVNYANTVTTGVYTAILILILWILLLSRSVSNRVAHLQTCALRISAGDLSARATLIGHDELTAMASSFNEMARQIEHKIASEQEARRRLEGLIQTLREASIQIAESASGILEATTKQAVAMSEESSAVSETSVIVGQLKQVTLLSTQKAEEVAHLARTSEQVSLQGKEAVERSVQGMTTLRQEVQAIAADMQHLSEQTQAIGEIISTVQELAEQSNMLAVNAAIEAARAGEHGYGFSVVANEVRSLAEQSRQATVQVRSILGEVQKSVQTALNNTATGTRAAETGMELVNQAGQAIRSLADTISLSSNSASQIRASSEQQAAGVEQIAQAIASIQIANQQTLENTQQSEEQAKIMKKLSLSLRNLLQTNQETEQE